MSSGDVSGWYVATFLAGVLVTLIGVGLAQLWRSRQKTHVHQTAKDLEGCRPAWNEAADPEKGEASKTSEDADELTPRRLRETLRQLLESELAKGLKQSGLAEQLERLEEKVAGSLPDDSDSAKAESKACALGLRAAANAEDVKASCWFAARPHLHSFMLPQGQGLPRLQTVETRTPNSSDRSGNSFPPPEDLPGAVLAPPSEPAPVLPQSAEPVPPIGSLSPPPPPTAAPNPAAPSPPPPPQPQPQLQAQQEQQQPSLPSRPGLELGPTSRQLDFAEPPEKGPMTVDEEASLQESLRTVQRVLHKRDVQTTELHRQLKQARQELWLQTSEARVATTRLHEILSDPSRAPSAQAEAIGRLKQEVAELSSRFASAKDQAMHWSSIAKRQRQFFLQNEKMVGEGMMLLKRHPCGEVFLAPPPVTAPYEDEDAVECGSGWDVGTSHCDPYKVDSWPFEPNVLAARASREPGLHQCMEGEDEDDDDEEADPRRPEWRSGDDSLEDDASRLDGAGDESEGDSSPAPQAELEEEGAGQAPPSRGGAAPAQTEGLSDLEIPPQHAGA